MLPCSRKKSRAENGLGGALKDGVASRSPRDTRWFQMMNKEAGEQVKYMRKHRHRHRHRHRHMHRHRHRHEHEGSQEASIGPSLWVLLRVGWLVSTSCGESVAKGQTAGTFRFLTRKPWASPFKKRSTLNSGKESGLPSSAEVLVTKKPTRSPLPNPGNGFSCPVGNCTSPYPTGCRDR